jgi:hypothetical protein
MPTISVPSYTNVEISIDLSDHLDDLDIDLEEDAILELLDDMVEEDVLAQHLADNGALSRVLSCLDEAQLKSLFESQSELFKLALVGVGALDSDPPPTLSELARQAVLVLDAAPNFGSPDDFAPFVAARAQVREAARLLASNPDSRAVLQEAVTAAHVSQQWTAWLNQPNIELAPLEAEAVARAAATASETGENGAAPPAPQEGAGQ